MPGVPLAAAVTAAERLRQRLAAQDPPGVIGSPITVSVGVARYPDHGATLDAVYQRADQALYYAKNHGRNAVCVADNDTPDGARRASPG